MGSAPMTIGYVACCLIQLAYLFRRLAQETERMKAERERLSLMKRFDWTPVDPVAARRAARKKTGLLAAIWK